MCIPLEKKTFSKQKADLNSRASQWVSTEHCKAGADHIRRASIVILPDGKSVLSGLPTSVFHEQPFVAAVGRILERYAIPDGDLDFDSPSLE